MNVKRSLLFLGCSYIYCRFCFCGIDAESGPYNIAQGKPTQQGPDTYCDSYNYGRFCHRSDHAVDNDLGQIIRERKCSHTKGRADEGSWWRVDFQGNYYLSYIRILRRSDVNCCGGDRMSGITIRNLSSSHIIYSADDAGIFNYTTDVNTTIPEELKNMQFSGISISVSGPFLTLCEVQVFLDMTRYCLVPNLEHGTIMEHSQPVAAEVVPVNVNLTYACEAGFTPFHQVQLECRVDGLRDGTYNVPSCSETTCGELNQTQNAIWTPKGSTCFSYGCYFTMKCHTGYMPSVTGQITTTCDENGQWTEPKGRCEAKECPLENNTDVNFTIVNRQEKFIYNDTLTAKCIDGHELSSGNLTRSCLESGTWSGSEPVCTIVVCQRPAEDPLLIFNLSSIDSTFYYGTFIQTACVGGYKHTSGSLTIRCQANKTWSRSPVCEAMQCSAPSLVANGKYFKTSTNGTEKESISTPNKFALETKLQFECDDGFFLSHQDNLTRICLDNETWSEEEPKCNEITSKKSDGTSDGNTAVIGGAAGAVVAVIFAVIFVVVLIFMRRRRKNADSESSYERSRSPGGENQRVYSNISQCYDESGNIATEVNKAHDGINDDDKLDIQVKDTPDEYYNIASCEKKSLTAILLEDLADFVLSGKTATDKMESQFTALPTGLKQSHKISRKPENATKNRYKNIYPYDANRVVLTDGKEKSDTDYINASYINGFDDAKAYVASQGPTKDMINDFWRMVWQLNSSKIVMLTNLTENNKMKCKQYWPDEGAQKFGNITVKMRDSDIYSDFVIRTLAIKQELSKEKIVQQFHFTVWPDKGVPKYSSAIVNFRNKVKHATSRGKGPVIVHCSAGIGRTGTYIALDILSEQGKTCGYVDIARCVEELRRQRVNMVQTLDQYIFLHTVLTEALMLSSSAVPVAKFQEVYKELLQVDPVKRKRNIVVTYEMLKHMSPVADDTQYISAKDVKNREKNRYSNILPVSEFMPRLYGSLKEIYINAVYLPSYKDNKALILTQMPLENTKSDFWALIRQHQVHTIVMMNTVAETKDGEIYWPDIGESHIYNDTEVETLESEEIGEHTVVTIKMTDDKSERVVKFIQCRYWPASQILPHSPSDLIRTLDIVQSFQQQSGNHPLVVHCMNGVDRSGLFCVVSAVIERLKIEQDVAIAQVIEEMRLCRDQLIPSIEQFQFCHEVILTYIQQFSEYSNFSAL